VGTNPFPREKPCIGILFGGPSFEREVSFASAQTVFRLLHSSPLAERYTFKGFAIPPEKPFPFDLLARGGIDLWFPVLHGTFGEDGQVQALLEQANVPYLGSDLLSSATCFDKLTMRQVLRAGGFAQPAFVGIETKVISPERVASKIPFWPCFVKPSRTGSSLGISRVKSLEGLPSALATALEFDHRLIVEKALRVRELECSVLEGDTPMVSAVGEVRYESDFYDFQTKYSGRGNLQLLVPAPLPAYLTRKVQKETLEVFRWMGCRDLARVDFFLCTDTGTLLVNEVNTLPGFTAQSMFPKTWQSSGLAFHQVLDTLFQRGLARRRDTR